jgi:hypothetical protein
MGHHNGYLDGASLPYEELKLKQLLHVMSYLNSKTQNSGPLHAQAKSRDLEIVRAQKEVSKGRPKTPPKPCSVVTGPRV